MYCIDASVLVNSFMKHEDHYEASKKLIEKIKKEISAKFAAYYKIRGYDSIYVAVSHIFGVKLITLDTEQIERSKNLISSSAPEDELKMEEL